MAALVFSLLSCGREITGPTPRLAMHGFSFAPRFVDRTMANGVAGDLVPFTRVRVRILNGSGLAVVDRVVDFPSAATEVPLELTVPLSSGTTTEGEVMELSLAFINAQGDTVFRGGPIQVNVAPNQSGSQPPPPVEVPVEYIGIGANAASVVITSAIDTVVAGQNFSYAAEARDALGAVIPNTPIAWRVITPGKATMSGSGGGSGTTLASRGEALIVAQLLTGQADTLPLEILPLAQSLAIVSGANQTAALGALLPAPLVVRVNASDNQPMAGVAVTFAVTAGGGSLSQLIDTTDASGLASVGWTTGTSLAAQTVTATSTGLTGSPVTFTALAPALALVFDTGPTSVAVGAPITPPVRVSVRDGQGNVATGFTGNVGLTLGAGSPAGVLSGTTSVAAVAGIATFSDLSLNLVGTGYNLVASAPSLSLTSAQSASFAVDPLTLANTWINASGGNWSNPANWSLGRTPEATDSVIISTGGPYTVTMDVSDTVAFLVLGGASGGKTLDVGTRQLRVDSSAVVQFEAVLTATTGSIVGPAVVQNFGQIILTGGTHSFALVNSKFLTLRGSAVYSGVLTTTSTSEIESLAQAGPTSANPTITNGFTNNGLVQLRTLDGFFGNQLTVGGTLVNAPAGVIRAVTGFGGKTLAAQLDNQGTVDVAEALALGRASAVHLNSGSIVVSGGDLSVTQSGTTPSFTNAGTITLGAARALSVTGGTLNLIGGTLTGATGGLGTNGVTLNFDLPSARTRLSLTNTTVPGTFTVPAGDSLVLTGGSPTMTLVNEGRLVLRAGVVLGGTLTTAVGSVLEVRSQADPGGANATITNGFTNNGLLELRTLDGFFGNQLTVGGTLVNSSLGTIRAVAGFGGKTLVAQLDNQGTVEVNEALSLERASATHVNTGSIVLNGGSLSINQSGTTPSFTLGFGGAIDIPPGGSVTFSGGAVDLRLGSVTGGAGGVLSNSTTSFQLDPASFEPRLTINGAATSPSAITIAAGDSLRVNGGTFAPSALTVDGTLIVEGTHSLNTAGLVINNGGLLLVRSSNVTAGAAFTLNSPFTTNGTVRLTSIDGNWSSSLTMGASALTVGATGTLELLSGTGGTRSLTAASIDNNGAIAITGAALIGGAIAQRNQMNVSVGATATLQNPMTLFTGSVTTNLGTLNLTGGCVVNGVPTFSGFVCP